MEPIGQADVVVIGGGIAGASVAHGLVRRGASVLLAEAEPVLAHHTTGRSAAMFLETYGPEQTRRLTLASRATFEQPPGLDRSLLTPRGFLLVSSDDHRDAVEAAFARSRSFVPSVRLLEGETITDRCPALRPASAAIAVWEPEASDVDVAGLHQAYIAEVRRAGGRVLTSAPATRIDRVHEGWRVQLGGQLVQCRHLVNAAGAWADEIAVLAGVEPVCLQPLRRTAFTAALPAGSRDIRDWPLVGDIDEHWYLKPEGDGLLCSLAEENPSPPTDVRPREEDVALALERINDATDLGLRHVRSAWTGLRTFAPDRELVLGPDPGEPAFSWYVGLGGFGIQTAPAAGELVAAFAVADELPPALRETGVDPRALAPRRDC